LKQESDPARSVNHQLRATGRKRSPREIDTSTAPNPGSPQDGLKAPLSINPEHTPGVRPGIVEGLIALIYSPRLTSPAISYELSRDFRKSPETPDYTPACRQAGIMKRLRGLQIHWKIKEKSVESFFSNLCNQRAKSILSELSCLQIDKIGCIMVENCKDCIWFFVNLLKLIKFFKSNQYVGLCFW
jgi:hypothetical protein